jgi:uncharacterized protein involved in exopolysaccharide biosynthesis
VGLPVAGASPVLSPAKHEAATTILFDTPRVHYFGQQALITETIIETHAAIDGQLKILKSDVIAERVIHKLGLKNDPDFSVPGSSPGLLAAFDMGNTVLKTDAQRQRHFLRRLREIALGQPHWRVICDRDSFHVV